MDRRPDRHRADGLGAEDRRVNRMLQRPRSRALPTRTHRLSVTGPTAAGPRALGPTAAAPLALAAAALGAVAIGQLMIARLAVKRAVIRELRIGRLEVDDLVVRRHTVDQPVGGSTAGRS
ncbi:hypothetical protein GCM10010169_61890 [Micromonospora fulviviridis]|nr:hypothetical protein GCM10010169_61890 [Micromonospora fulviviridis]